MLIEKEVKAQWMVIARHFGMPGGLLDYGVAEIEEFFDTFHEADEYAKNLFRKTASDLVYPMVWVLKCERTYQKVKEGLCVAVSKGSGE